MIYLLSDTMEFSWEIFSTNRQLFISKLRVVKNSNTLIEVGTLL